MQLHYRSFADFISGQKTIFSYAYTKFYLLFIMQQTSHRALQTKEKVAEPHKKTYVYNK